MNVVKPPEWQFDINHAIIYVCIHSGLVAGAAGALVICVDQLSQSHNVVWSDCEHF
jgi:hypothetical protein